MGNLEITEAGFRELVAFCVGGQHFCIEIRSVREIRGWTPATIIPYAPDYVMGVINLRGAVVPIVDLSRRLGLEKSVPDDRHVIIIAVVGSRTSGFLVDAVSDIIEISSDEIQPPPDVSSRESSEFIEGVIIEGERILRVVDIESLLPVGSEESEG